jgi:hypothetical protein
MSRYDRKDPSQDPDYCDGLSDAPICFWCGQRMDPDYDGTFTYDPYCSQLCTIQAERDSQEDN